MKNAIVTFIIVAFLTSFPGLPAQAQYEEGAATIDVSQYYGGVETTNFGVRDPETGVWVQVPASRLPWWWTPPPDWVLWSTLGIATAAVVMSAVFIGEGLSFGSVVVNDHRFRGRLAHFQHFRDSVVGPRFRTHYESARRDAERKHPEGLRHSPGTRGSGTRGSGPGVRNPGPGTRGPAGPGGMKQPGGVAPPPKAGTSGSGGIRRNQGAPPPPAKSTASTNGMHKPPPPPAGMSTGKSGLPPTKTGPPPPAARKGPPPPAGTGMTGQGMGQKRQGPPPRAGATGPSIGMGGQPHPQMGRQPVQQRPVAQPRQQRSAPAQQQKRKP